VKKSAHQQKPVDSIEKFRDVTFKNPDFPFAGKFLHPPYRIGSAEATDVTEAAGKVIFPELVRDEQVNRLHHQAVPDGWNLERTLTPIRLIPQAAKEWSKLEASRAQFST
jgi:hypothetical protein